MPSIRAADGGLVRVYPKRVTYIEGVPHVEQEVTRDRAAFLTGWMSGAAFTIDPADPERIMPPSTEAGDEPPTTAATDTPADEAGDEKEV